MNKIVVRDYPVSRLPEELRQGLEADSPVEVTLVQGTQLRGPTVEELVAQLETLRNNPKWPTTTAEEAARRIRELRDEWDG